MTIDITKTELVRRVLLVAPVPPPYGGMALQAALVAKKLSDDGTTAHVLGYNHPLPYGTRFFEGIPGVRTCIRTVRFCIQFWASMRSADVVHVLGASWLYFLLVVTPAILIARLHTKRVVLNYRGGDADCFLKRCGWFTKPVFRMATIVTAPSEFLASVIKSQLNVQVSVVPNLVDLTRFRYRSRSSFRPKMLVTRHLEELYGVESVLRAFRQIQTEYPSASLWIAGTGTQERYLRDRVLEWNLQNVEFLGYVDHKRLPAVYDQCDILLNGSRVDNFPASLIEASASGLVVISTDAGGIPFIFKNGENALLAPVGDWNALASAVLRVLQDEDLPRQLVAGALRVCRQCEWTNVREYLYRSYGLRPEQTGSTSPKCAAYV